MVLFRYDAVCAQGDEVLLAAHVTHDKSGGYDLCVLSFPKAIAVATGQKKGELDVMHLLFSRFNSPEAWL